MIIYISRTVILFSYYISAREPNAELHRGPGCHLSIHNPQRKTVSKPLRRAISSMNQPKFATSLRGSLSEHWHLRRGQARKGTTDADRRQCERNAECCNLNPDDTEQGRQVDLCNQDNECSRQPSDEEVDKHKLAEQFRVDPSGAWNPFGLGPCSYLLIIVTTPCFSICSDMFDRRYSAVYTLLSALLRQLR